MRTRTNRLLATASALVLAVTLGTGSVATANGAGHGHGGGYYQPPTPYDDEGQFDPECEGVDVRVEFKAKGVSSLRNVRGSGGEAFLLSDHYKFFESWINDATDEVLFTAKGRFEFDEISAKRVRKSDVPADANLPPGGLVGPIYEFTSVEVGWEIDRDADGNALYRTRGLVVFKSLFDTFGDREPGGWTLTVDPVKVKGPHPLLGKDFCEVAEEQL